MNIVVTNCNLLPLVRRIIFSTRRRTLHTYPGTMVQRNLRRFGRKSRRKQFERLLVVSRDTWPTVTTRSLSRARHLLRSDARSRLLLSDASRHRLSDREYPTGRLVDVFRPLSTGLRHVYLSPDVADDSDFVRISRDAIPAL